MRMRLVPGFLAILSLFVVSPSFAQSRAELDYRLKQVEQLLAGLDGNIYGEGSALARLTIRLDDLERLLTEQTGQIERLHHDNQRLRDELARLRKTGGTEGGKNIPTDSLASIHTPMIEGKGPGEIRPAPEGESQVSSEDSKGKPVILGGSYVAVDPEDPYAEAKARATGVLGDTLAEEETNIRPDSNTAPGALEKNGVQQEDKMSVNTPENAQKDYEEAKRLLAEGNFEAARAAFETFVTAHTKNALQGEAYYWLGETYFVHKNMTRAASSYIQALKNNPKGPKAPEAMARLAESLESLGKKEEACRTVGQFGREYPNAPSAAKNKIDLLKRRAGC